MKAVAALTALLALAATPAGAEPLNTLREPYGTCDQQTLDEAVALERLGDREALRDHLRSYGCRLIWPREGLQPFPPERRVKRPYGSL
jgi:hypothetical protein